VRKADHVSFKSRTAYWYQNLEVLLMSDTVSTCFLSVNNYWKLPPLAPYVPGLDVGSFQCESESVRVTLQLTVSQSVCLGVEPNLGLLTKDIWWRVSGFYTDGNRAVTLPCCATLPFILVTLFTARNGLQPFSLLIISREFSFLLWHYWLRCAYFSWISP
jgi:hypothetical protein